MTSGCQSHYPVSMCKSSMLCNAFLNICLLLMIHKMHWQGTCDITKKIPNTPHVYILCLSMLDECRTKKEIFYVTHDFLSILTVIFLCQSNTLSMYIASANVNNIFTTTFPISIYSMQWLWMPMQVFYIKITVKYYVKAFLASNVFQHNLLYIRFCLGNGSWQFTSYIFHTTYQGIYQHCYM